MDYRGVPVRRFPCVAALTCCSDPSCFSNDCCRGKLPGGNALFAKQYKRGPEGCGEGASTIAQATCAAKGGEWKSVEAAANGCTGNGPLSSMEVTVCDDPCARGDFSEAPKAV